VGGRRCGGEQVALRAARAGAAGAEAEDPHGGELTRSALAPAGRSLPAPTADVAELLGTHARGRQAELA